MKHKTKPAFIPFSFRPIQKSDIPILAKSYKQNYLALFASRYAPSRFISNGMIQSKFHLWLGIICDKKLIGSIWMEKDELNSFSAKLGILIHFKEYWSRGIGYNVLTKAIPILSQKLHVSRIFLNVRNDNYRAISCYNKCAFSIVDKRTKSARGQSISYYIMRRDLDSCLKPIPITHPIQIYQASLRDLWLLTKMNVHLREDEYIDNIMSDNQVYQRMKSFLKGDYKAYLFKSHKTILGYALLDFSNTPLYLRQFFIVRQYRSKGIGTKAFNLLIKKLKCEILDIEVLSWNQRGVRFWEKLGFKSRSISMRYKNQKRKK